MSAVVRSELVFDTTRMEPWEIAARLDMLLVYPQASPERMRRLVNAVCADQIEVLLEEEPERRAELIERYPHYDPKTIRIERKNIFHLRETAALVGVAFLSLIKQAAVREPPILPGSMKQLSLDQIATYLWPRHDGESEVKYLERLHELEKRQIRKLYPVAHLAAAFQWLARERADHGESPIYSYRDLDFHRRWVAKANEIAGYIRATPKLQKIASKLIELRWVEGEQVSTPSAA